jgi:hypothetical protein
MTKQKQSNSTPATIGTNLDNYLEVRELDIKPEEITEQMMAYVAFYIKNPFASKKEACEEIGVDKRTVDGWFGSSIFRTYVRNHIEESLRNVIIGNALLVQKEAEDTGDIKMMKIASDLSAKALKLLDSDKKYNTRKC